eukprot:7040440-Pyramimonas_sp.AAC.1
MRYWKAKCTLGESLLAVAIRKVPRAVGRLPNVVASSPASGLAMKARAVRAAVASEPISQTMNTPWCSV